MKATDRQAAQNACRSIGGKTMKRLSLLILILALVLTLCGCRWEIAPGLALKIELEVSQPASTAETTPAPEVPPALIDPTINRDPNEGEPDIIP